MAGQSSASDMTSRSIRDETTEIKSPSSQDVAPTAIDRDLETGNASRGGDPVPEEDVYTVFTRTEIGFIAVMASISTFFSPLTANIYFPALNTIATDLGVSDTLVNLTVTTYMIFQGLAPSIVGGLSDSIGRRPMYLFCFVLYIVANVALGAQSSYAGLLVLRCLQSGGISGTVALSNAAIADIITSAERGTYIGWASVGGALGPSLSPIIGGLLSQYLGYHSVFWFLAILGGVYLVIMLLFFPETGRKVVGNGSIPPPRWSRSFLNYRSELKRRRAGAAIDFSRRDALARQRRGLKIPNPVTATVVMVMELETGLLLIFMGLLYAGLYAIFVGIPSLFNDIYGFNDLELGLVFLALGIGGLLAALTQGKLLDWNWARHARRLGVPVNKSRQQDLSDFPIERARLEIAVLVVFLSGIFCIAYGWLLQYEVPAAGPIVVLFLLGYLAIASFNPLSILIVDMHPQSPGTATAAMNLVRCLLGAGATAVVLPMLNAMGRGWAYTFVGLLQLVLIPLQLAIIRWGPLWRSRQREKDSRKEEKEREKEREKGAGAKGDELKDVKSASLPSAAEYTSSQGQEEAQLKSIQEKSEIEEL